MMDQSPPLTQRHINISLKPPTNGDDKVCYPSNPVYGVKNETDENYKKHGLSWARSETSTPVDVLGSQKSMWMIRRGMDKQYCVHSDGEE